MKKYLRLQLKNWDYFSLEVAKPHVRQKHKVNNCLNVV